MTKMMSAKEEVSKALYELNERKKIDQSINFEFVSTWLSNYEYLWDEDFFMYYKQPNKDLIEISDCIAQMSSYLSFFENNMKAKYFYDSYQTLGFNQDNNLRIWMKKVYAECSSFIFSMRSVKESDIRNGVLFIEDCRLKFEELQFTYFLTKLFQENIAYACDEYHEDLRLVKLQLYSKKKNQEKEQKIEEVLDNTDNSKNV